MELISAAKNGDFTQVFDLLQTGYRADSRDHDNATPLYWSACHGHATLCEVLLQAGCDVNARVKWGSTPLHAASDRGHTDCVKILIENGANVNCQNNRGDTPLHIAAYRGNMLIVHELLRASTDTTLTNDNRKTPQEEAIEGGHKDIAECITAFKAGHRDVLNTRQRNLGQNIPTNGSSTACHSRFHPNGSGTTTSLTESVCSSYDSIMDTEQSEYSDSLCDSSAHESKPINLGAPTFHRSISVGSHMTSGAHIENINTFGDVHYTGYPNHVTIGNDVNKGYSSLENLGNDNTKVNFRTKPEVECKSLKLTSNGRCIATESIDYSTQEAVGQENVLRRDLSETGLQNISNTHPLRASTGSVKDVARLSENVDTFIRTLQTQLINAYKEIETLSSEKEDLKFKCSTVLIRLNDTEKRLDEKNEECEKLKDLVDVLQRDSSVERFVNKSDLMDSRRIRGSTKGQCVQSHERIEISTLQNIVKDKLLHLSQRLALPIDIPGRGKQWVPGEDYVIIGDKQTTWLGVTSSKRVPLAVGFSIKHLKTGKRLCLTMLLFLEDPTLPQWTFRPVVMKTESKLSVFNKHPNVLSSLHRYEESTERFRKFVTAPKSKSVRLCAKTMFNVTMETKIFQTLMESIDRDRNCSTFPLSLYGSYMEFTMQISYQLLRVVNDLEVHNVFHGNISENTVVFDKTLRPLLSHIDLFDVDCARAANGQSTSISGDYINIPNEKVRSQGDLLSVCELLDRTLFSKTLVPCLTLEDQNLQRRFSLVKQTLHDVTLSTSSVPNCQSVLKRVGFILCGPTGSDVRSQTDCDTYIRQKLLHVSSGLESTRYKDIYADYLSIPESVDLRRPEVLAHFLCSITAAELWEIFQSRDMESIRVH